jgi:hypothetical protein
MREILVRPVQQVDDLSLQASGFGAQKQFFLRRVAQSFGQANFQRFCDAQEWGFWARWVFGQARALATNGPRRLRLRGQPLALVR